VIGNCCFRLELAPGGDGDPRRPPAKALRTHSTCPRGKWVLSVGGDKSFFETGCEAFLCAKYIRSYSSSSPGFVCHAHACPPPTFGLCPAHVQNLFEVSSGVTQEVTFYIFIVWICHFKLKLCQRRYEWHEGEGL